ncbi:N-acetyltransferase family protein [Lysinibacillus sp. fkY74-1]|uniref:GNAT family N-acetyltransferase n=1 Tax=Lysinibacillus sphaericus TaxID=1421 RepID=UPI000559E381|nr:GNAT family N-acetyltransferase [Lysinibacillus sphaericus]MBG9757274.1 acetyltransferase [Lysinibacillus sphaericus]MDM5352369.1 GNAT family N-acetyltransferase [Lysinibacillus sphaericus]MEB7454386.1 GNAT family N-acetyltransferase [Lysinibacillus sphaericus]QIC47137.1 GNAT family N-acetyltransferase [Lysinibacillus sphaericus]QPA53754.1 GNAT family N-acetyltransferase [Lysinibacillus sphaericus]
MEIRLLTAQDATSYRTLRLEGLQTNPEAFGSSFEEEKDMALELFASRLEAQGSFTFGAFDQNELCGVATLVQESKMKLKHKASIFAVYVSPKKRGHGLGKRLMQEIIKQGKQLADVEQINLTVVSSNESAKGLYTSLGFLMFGTEKRALKIDHQCFDEDYMVLYVKPLK